VLRPLKEMAPVLSDGEYLEVNTVNIQMPYIEQVTAQRLRELPLCDEDIYCIEEIEVMEEEDELTPSEGGFMMGYLDDALHR